MPIVIALVVLAVAAAAAWLLRGGSVAPLRPPELPAVTARDAATPDPAESATPPASAGTPFDGRAPAEPTLADATRAAGEAELTDHGWRELCRELGPGELDVLVLRGRRSVAGAHVRVWPRGNRRLGEEGAAPPWHVGTTDTEGRAAWTGIAAGSYVVRADDGDQHVVAVARVRGPGGARQVVLTTVLLFGSASIDVVAQDEHGAPLAAVPVHVAEVGPQPDRAVTSVTERDGTAAFRGLHGGRYHVGLDRADTPWSAANQRMVRLDPGERARVQFGGPPPAGLVRGRIVDGDGQPLPHERRLSCVHVEHDDERLVTTARDGTFSIALPPGRWQVGRDDGRRIEVLAVADVDRVAVDVDVPWPGIRLLAVIPASPDLVAGDVAAHVGLRDAAGRTQQGEGTFTVGGRPCVQWTGLAPGEYVLQPQGGLVAVDAPPEGARVVLTTAPVQRVALNVRGHTVEPAKAR